MRGAHFHCFHMFWWFVTRPGLLSNYLSILTLAVNEPGMVESINSHLPADIRVQGIKRVTKNFNSKNK